MGRQTEKPEADPIERVRAWHDWDEHEAIKTLLGGLNHSHLQLTLAKAAVGSGCTMDGRRAKSSWNGGRTDTQPQLNTVVRRVRTYDILLICRLHKNRQTDPYTLVTSTPAYVLINAGNNGATIVLFRLIRQQVVTLLSKGNVRFGHRCEINFGTHFLAKNGSVNIGRRAHIRRGAIVQTYGGDITIGDNFSLNPYSIIYGPGRISIGNDVRVAAHVTIVASNHNFEDTQRTIKSQGSTSVGITIGNDVWIGANSVVLDGATIADGCVIAAGSVVRGETVEMGIYAGVPAKLKRLRGQSRNTEA